MRTQIPIIVIAVFSISILLFQSLFINPLANAQLTFTTTNITYTGNPANQSSCEYIDSSEVWCSSTDGIKIINPTSRSISSTLFSGIAIQDIECNSSHCYSWFNGDTATANMTQWDVETHDIINSTTFSMAGGAPVGRQIELVSAQGTENLIVPSSANSCGGAGTTSLKGVCIFNPEVGFFNASRFISSSDSGASAVVFNIKWSETLNTVAEPTLNNILVLFQDGAGTRTWRILNLNDADLTFATTQTCVSGSLAVLQAVAIEEIFVFSENYYVPIDNGATGYYAQLPIRSTDCLNTVTYPTTWDVPVALMTDGEFFYTASYQASGSRSAMQVYNSTGSALATYNTTNTSAPALPLRNGWYHSTEGELQILGNSRLLVFTVQEPEDTGTSGRDCDLPENANILICRLGQDGAEVGSAGAFIVGNTTEGTGLLGLGCTIGLVDCTDDPNPQTNGLGLLIFIASIFVIVGMFYAGLGGQNTWALFHGSPIILVLIIIALSAFFTITGIIDPIFLILSIVGIIALSAPKIIGLIQNRGFGGGGSTE